MEAKDLISDIKKAAKEHGIHVFFSKKQEVFDKLGKGKLPCSGFFCSSQKLLSIAANEDYNEWLSILVHESCHMDQYIEDSYLWNKTDCGYSLFFEWLEDGRIIKSEILSECVQDIISLEKDCDKRAVKKILKYDLPIDTENYIRAVNAYLFSYLRMLKTRKWIGNICNEPDVIAVSPKTFRKQYLKIPIRLEAALKRHEKKNAGKVE